MLPNRLSASFCRLPLLQYAWLIVIAVLISAVSFGVAQSPGAPKTSEPVSPPAASNNQATLTAPKPEAGKKPANENAEADAARLSTLADQLRDQLNNMNVNVLSLDVIQKTEAIEKLAKKIKGEADVR